MLQVTYLDGSGGEEDGGSAITRPGLVRVQHANGDVFQGNVVQSNANGEYVPHGEGKYTWYKNTSKPSSPIRECFYEGEYDHGERHGLGAYHYSNGTIYRGTWAHGRKHGPGAIIYTNGDRFLGAFFQDQKHGRGTYTYFDGGAQFVGEWANGRVVQGRWIFPPGAGSKLPTNVVSKKSRDVFGVIIAGPPASGKGTQCERIREEFGLVHLSTGDLLRAAVARQTPIGLVAKSVMEAGGLVSDELVIGAIEERLNQYDVLEHGFLLDGFPRTPAQAQALKRLGFTIQAFILLQVPDELILNRVTGRRVDPVTGNSYHVEFKPALNEEVAQRLVQRKDDTEECVVPRLEAYHRNIANVREEFAQCEILVNGTEEPSLVWKEIETKLKQVFT